MDELLARLLRTANPWLDDPSAFPRSARHRFPEPFLPRVVAETGRWPVAGRAHLVVGARQTGKSSLLWTWLRDRGTAPLFLNAEEPYIRSWCRSPTLAAADWAGLVPPDVPVFLDEAQHLDEAGLFVKGLIDGGLPNPLFVTGSSAFHLDARTRESLAGRAVRTVVHPFSLPEVTAHLADQPRLLRDAATREVALRQMVVGGYPEAWLAEEPAAVLHRLVDAFIVRDASDRFRIERVDAFRTLLALVAGQTGSLVNVAEWAGICGVARGTVNDYLSLLEETHVLQVVRPFVGGRRAELTNRPKLFFRDPGVRNAVAGQLGSFATRLDKGPLLEGWLAAELVKVLSPLAPRDTLRFWRSRSGAEVDFVVDRPNGLVAFECKATPLRAPRLTRSARSFIEAYRPRRFVVLNLALDATERLGETELRWLPPEAMAELSALLDDR